MTARTISVSAVTGIPMVQTGDDLCALILAGLRDSALTLADDDILVVAQKIVSKAEGRVVALASVEPSAEAISLAAETDKEPAIVQLILDESNAIIRHRPGVLIAEHKLGIVLANAGIDRSNVAEDADEVLLLPEDPDASARSLREQLAAATGLRLGVIIADSVGRAWRMGTTGMAIGAAGVEALANLRGRHDLFGRELQVSEHAVADSLAATAELLLGEANEATPVAHIRGYPAADSEQDSKVLLRPKHEDMFR